MVPLTTALVSRVDTGKTGYQLQETRPAQTATFLLNWPLALAPQHLEHGVQHM